MTGINPEAEPEFRVMRAKLDGNLARTAGPLPDRDYIIWDTDLKGFGLRVRSSGTCTWIVQARERNAQKKVTLGRVGNLDASTARGKARDYLARVSLDGLPRKPQVHISPIFADFAEEFARDYERHWKPSTVEANRGYIRRELIPTFGSMRVSDILRADVNRWRSSFTDRQGVFNRALPVLAVMLTYAEKLGYRPAQSNPAKRVSRFKRVLPERYLSPAEYRRLEAELTIAEMHHGLHVAAIRLLTLTGARSGEILGLKWAWVQPRRLMLPDSKTGPKIVWLCSQAEAVLASLPRQPGTDYVFASASGKPIRLQAFWTRFRRQCLLPNVRIHDLRHSFASVAVMHGIELPMVGRLLTHALQETTARYAHLADDTIAAAAQRVSASLASNLGFVR